MGNLAVKGIIKSQIQHLFEATSLDLRGVRWRLHGADAVASAVVREQTSLCSEKLLDLSLRLIARTRETVLPRLMIERNAPDYVDRWPGEHYRLLMAIVTELRPKRVIEVGTFSGLSSLAITQALSPGSTLTTFDVMPWNQIESEEPGAANGCTFLRSGDFASGKLTQVIGDLAELPTAERHAPLLRESEFLFIDGPKDGVFEQKLLDNLARIGQPAGTLLMFDDIRLMNMVKIWDDIRHPKLDFTGFGHFTGTGFVDWQG